MRVRGNQRLCQPLAMVTSSEIGANSIGQRLAERADRVVNEEIHEFIVGTVIAFGKRILEHLADIHGVGLLLRGAELAYKAMQWQRFAKGEGAVNAELLIPLGPGVNLELSVPLASDQDCAHLPLTMCYAPSGGSSVGVFETGGLEISPSAAHEGDRTESQHAASVDEPESEPSRQHGNLAYEDAAEDCCKGTYRLRGKLAHGKKVWLRWCVRLSKSYPGSVLSFEDTVRDLSCCTTPQLAACFGSASMRTTSPPGLFGISRSR